MSRETHIRRCALIFVRAPQIGKVKTRLCGFLDKETVLGLYKNFAEDVIETVQSQADHIRICFYPFNQKALVAGWLGNVFEYVPQKGKNLGERMETAFLKAFSDQFTHVILVGSDIPDLPESIIKEAFVHLDDGKAVIGPASDGGYYLVGFRKDMFLPQIFENIPWGTNRVFKNTLTALKKFHQSVHILPEWRDIDEYDDLLDFISKCKSGNAAASNTVRYLQKSGLI